MPSPPDPSSPSDARRLVAEAAAAEWLLALDRGLSADEQREFDAWVAADALHAEAWDEVRAMWARLDRAEELARPVPSPAPPAARKRRHRLVLAAAAVVVFAAGLFWREASVEPARPVRVVQIAPRLQTLADGTEVELNAEAEIRSEFTPAVRRVQLVRGEAHFKVKKRPAHPFEVDAGGVVVRALGTAFNVRLADRRVGVLVTEGRVEVVPTTGPAPLGMAPAAAAVLEPRQQVILPLAGGETPDVTTLSAADVEQTLSWQGLRLRFEEMPLAEVAAEFNRFAAARGRPRLVVAPSAAEVPVVGTFRADNVDVFLRFLERGFGVKVEPRGDGTIVLRQGP